MTTKPGFTKWMLEQTDRTDYVGLLARKMQSAKYSGLRIGTWGQAKWEEYFKQSEGMSPTRLLMRARDEHHDTVIAPFYEAVARRNGVDVDALFTTPSGRIVYWTYNVEVASRSNVTESQIKRMMRSRTWQEHAEKEALLAEGRALDPEWWCPCGAKMTCSGYDGSFHPTCKLCNELSVMGWLPGM